MNRFRSFRDPDGYVVFDRASVWRRVHDESDLALQELLGLGLVVQRQEEGLLINARRGSAKEFAAFSGERVSDDDTNAFYEHPRIDFPSFAVEWPAEMLYAAAELTITLAEELLPNGWSLKDANPYNILFRGPSPVFIDILSFEKRRANDPIWLPLNQFVSTFLLPLLLHKKLELPISMIFHAGRPGIEIKDAAGQFGTLSKLSPSVFSLVTLPLILGKIAERKSDLYTGNDGVSPSRAAFILRLMFQRLRRQLRRVTPDAGRDSHWTEYSERNIETQPEYMEAKRAAVEKVVSELKTKRVLEIGCNTGYFTSASVKAGASVVAIDNDEAVVGAVWRKASREGLDVLPLVVDIARPTPAAGWRNSETPSFLERAYERFDLVTMLAVIHHLIVSDRIPLREVLALAADITTDRALIEFVPTDDPMFIRIARGRDHLHAGLTTGSFESAAGEFFELIEKMPMPGTKRVLYTFKKK